MRRLTSLSDLRARCEVGERQAQELAIAGARLLGAEEVNHIGASPWVASYLGLERHLSSITMEYRDCPGDAEAMLVDELNGIIEALARSDDPMDPTTLWACECGCEVLAVNQPDPVKWGDHTCHFRLVEKVAR